MQNASNTPRSPDDDGPLRIAQGRLARSLQGAFQAGGAREGFVKVSVTGRKLRMEKGSRVPWAAIHEFGGTTHPRVTQKSRRFFWAMYFETGEDKWRAMALTKKQRFTVTIPKRPYLEPALEDEEPRIRQRAEDRLHRLIIGSLDRHL